jgi:H+/Cl- antiporter ClcA
MAACVVGVTKATIGSTLVVTEMAGLQLLPTTLVASLAALWLTSNVGLIETQREREEKADFGGGRTRAALTSALTRLCTMSKCEATGAVLRP